MTAQENYAILALRGGVRLNSPTTTRIKLNVLKDDGTSNDIIEIELRELMF